MFCLGTPRSLRAACWVWAALLALLGSATASLIPDDAPGVPGLIPAAAGRARLAAISGLELLLQADAGVGAVQWEDQSGNGHHATATSNLTRAMPSVVQDGTQWGTASFPALRFDGFDDGLCVSAALQLSDAFTCTVVDRFESAGAMRGRSLHTAGPIGANGWWMGLNIGSHGFGFGDDKGSAVEALAPVGPTWHVHTLTVDRAAGAYNATFYVDGVQPGWAKPATNLNFSPKTLAIGACGASALAATLGTPVRVAAIACYNRALSTAERADVEVALASTYGIHLAVVDGAGAGSVDDIVNIDRSCAPGAAAFGTATYMHPIHFNDRRPPYLTNAEYPQAAWIIGPEGFDMITSERFGDAHGVAASGSVVGLARGWRASVSTTPFHHAFVYERRGATWRRTILLDPQGNSSTQASFGISIAVYESSDGGDGPALVAVGKGHSLTAAAGATEHGRVVVFCRKCDNVVGGATAAARWGHVATLLEPAAHRSATSVFGGAVALASDGSFLVVGAPGHGANTGCAYLFATVDGGKTWTADDQLVPSVSVDAQGYFGYSVAAAGIASDAFIAVGAPGQNWSTAAALTPAAARGAVFLFNAGTPAIDGAVRVRREDWYHAGVNDGAGSALGWDVGVDVVGSRVLLAAAAPDYNNRAGWYPAWTCNRTAPAQNCSFVVAAPQTAFQGSSGTAQLPIAMGYAVGLSARRGLLMTGMWDPIQLRAILRPVRQSSALYLNTDTWDGYTAGGDASKIINTLDSSGTDLELGRYGLRLADPATSGGSPLVVAGTPLSSSTGQQAGGAVLMYPDFKRDQWPVSAYGRNAMHMPGPPGTAAGAHGGLAAFVAADGQSVWVLEYDARADMWRHTETLGSPSAQLGGCAGVSAGSAFVGAAVASFGDALDSSGSAGHVIVVGVPNDASALVFVRSGRGQAKAGRSFSCSARLTGTPPSGSTASTGTSVAASGCCTIALGAPSIDRAYVFTRTSAAATSWSQSLTTTRDVSFGSGAGDYGRSVAFAGPEGQGRVLVVGAPTQGASPITNAGVVYWHLLSTARASVLSSQAERSPFAAANNFFGSAVQGSPFASVASELSLPQALHVYTNANPTSTKSKWVLSESVQGEVLNNFTSGAEFSMSGGVMAVVLANQGFPRVVSVHGSSAPAVPSLQWQEIARLQDENFPQDLPGGGPKLIMADYSSTQLPNSILAFSYRGAADPAGPDVHVISVGMPSPVYVSTRGRDDGIHTGGLDDPFRTLEAAVAAARPSGFVPANKPLEAGQAVLCDPIILLPGRHEGPDAVKYSTSCRAAVIMSIQRYRSSAGVARAASGRLRPAATVARVPWDVMSWPRPSSLPLAQTRRDLPANTFEFGAQTADVCGVRFEGSGSSGAPGRSSHANLDVPTIEPAAGGVLKLVPPTGDWQMLLRPRLRFSQFVGGIAANGGCVASDNAGIEILESEFDSCVARVSGGALFVSVPSKFQLVEGDPALRELSVTSSKLSSCSSFKGGAFGVSGATSALHRVAVTSCNGTMGGGALFAERSADVSITSSDFSFCRSDASSGGAVLVDFATVNLIDSVVRDSEASYTGGGAYAIGSATLLATNTTFARNIAGAMGGGVHIDRSASSLARCTFDGNKVGADGAGVGGGAAAFTLSVLGKTSALDACTFVNNEAPSGGGVLADVSAIVRVTGSVFDSNTATGVGDAAGGGAVFVRSSSVTLQGCSIRHNTATSAPGGGVRVVQTKASLQVTATNVTANGASSSWGGGVACSDGAAVTVTHSSLKSNVAHRAGGGAFLRGCRATIKNSTFSSNAVSTTAVAAALEVGSGGGLLVTATASERRLPVAVTGTAFVGNRALRGGAFASLPDSDNATCTGNARACELDTMKTPSGAAFGPGLGFSVNEAGIVGDDFFFATRAVLTTEGRLTRVGMVSTSTPVRSVAGAPVALALAAAAPTEVQSDVSWPALRVRLVDSLGNPALAPPGAAVSVSTTTPGVTTLGVTTAGFAPVTGPPASNVSPTASGSWVVGNSVAVLSAARALAPPGSVMSITVALVPALGVESLVLSLAVALCPAGTQVASSGVACSPCAVGFANPSSTNSSSACKACVGGYTLSTAAAQCSLCSAGQAPNPNKDGCIACGAGTVSATGVGCSACQPGTAPDALHTVCQPCEVGTFGTDGRTCTACSAGTYRSAAMSVASCPNAPAGTFQSLPGQAVVLPCQRGHYSEAGAKSCVPCSPGSFAASVGRAGNCTPCSAGTFAEEQGLAGCLPCPAGSYSSKQSAKSAAECVPCKEGTTTAEPGASSVDQCVAQPGRVTQRKRVVGPDGSVSYVDEPVVCPVGADCDEPGLTVQTMRLLRGFWRATVDSLNVKPCPVERFCAGGRGGGLQMTGVARPARLRLLTAASNATNVTLDASPLCVQGHRGPYCLVCMPGYAHEGALDSPCVRCDAATPMPTEMKWAIGIGAAFAAAVLFGLAAVLLRLIANKLWPAEETIRKAAAAQHKADHWQDEWKHEMQLRAAGTYVNPHGDPTRALRMLEESGIKVPRVVASRLRTRPPGPAAGAARPLTEVSPSGSSVAVSTGTSAAATLADAVSTKAAQVAASPRPTGSDHDAKDDAGTPGDAAQGKAEPDVEEEELGAVLESVQQDIKNSPIAVKVKLVLGFYQVMTSMPAVFPSVNFGAMVESLLGGLAIVNVDVFEFISPPGCSLPTDFYSQLAGMTMGPVFLSLSLLALAVFVEKCAPSLLQRVRKQPPRGAAAAGAGEKGPEKRLEAYTLAFQLFLIVTFSVYPSVSSKILQTFKCDTYDDGSSYLTADVSIDCAGPNRGLWQLYAAVMFLVYPVGIPVFYFVTLRRVIDIVNPLQRLQQRRTDWRRLLCLGTVVRADPKSRAAATAATVEGGTEMLEEANRLRLVSRAMAEREARREEIDHLKFLWEAYEPQYYWYECVEMGRKFLLTGVTIFFMPGTPMQVVFAMLICLFSIMLLTSTRPYAFNDNDQLATFTQWQIYFGLLATLLLMVNVSPEEPGAGDAFKVALVIINLSSAAMALYLIAYSQYIGEWNRVRKEHPGLPVLSLRFVQALRGVELPAQPQLSEAMAIKLKVKAAHARAAVASGRTRGSAATAKAEVRGAHRASGYPGVPEAEAAMAALRRSGAHGAHDPRAASAGSVRSARAVELTVLPAVHNGVRAHAGEPEPTGAAHLVAEGANRVSAEPSTALLEPAAAPAATSTVPTASTGAPGARTDGAAAAMGRGGSTTSMPPTPTPEASDFEV